MFKLLKIELSRALKSKLFLIAILIGCVISISHFIQYVIPGAAINYSGADMKGGAPISAISRWIGGTGYALHTFLYYLIAPIIACIPFADSFFIDKNTGYIKNIFTRTKKSHYYISKYISTFISGGLAVITPLLLNLYLTAMVLPSITPEVSAREYPIFDLSMWSGLFYTHPYIYTLLYLLIDFVFFGLIATIGLTVSHTIENRFAVLLAPFLYYILISFIFNTTNLDIFDPLQFLIPAQVFFGFKFSIILLEAIFLAVITFGFFIFKGVKTETF